MGWKQEELKVVWRQSNHNSEQDEIDEKLGEDLENRIRNLCNEEKYQSIDPMVF